MEYRSETHKGPGLNDLKTTTHSGAILAKLQQKVARLEISLRDKEAEFQKVQSSLKNTHVHELKLQTEVYYQEILRLKNELNLLQETKNQGILSTDRGQPPVEASSRKNAAIQKNDNQASSENKTLVRSIESLKEENERLSCQLSSIQIEKERLELDFDRILKQAKMEELQSKKNPLVEGMTQTSPKHDPIPNQRPSEQTENALANLKYQIEELQKKEKAWEEEKTMYKDLILNLKEDRVFFKDTSQKRHDELWALQKELVKLQKDIGGFQVNGKPLCKQCTKPSYRGVKSSKKMLVKESSAPPNASSPQPSSKLPLKSKRLPTPQKTAPKQGFRSNVSKSSASSSPSSSALSSSHSSPSHLPRKRSSLGSQKPSAQSSSESSSSGKRSSTSRPIPTLSSDSPAHPRPQRDESKEGLEVEQEKATPLRTTDQEEDEEIVREILRNFDFFEVISGEVSHAPESVPEGAPADESGSRDLDLASIAPDEESEGEREAAVDDTPEESGCGDSQEEEQEHIDTTTQKLSGDPEALCALLESHFLRRKKLAQVMAERKEKSPQKTTKRTAKISVPKSPSKSSVVHKSPSKTKSPSKSTTRGPTKTRPPPSTPKKSPHKKPQTEAPADWFESEGGEQPQNIKDIDQMICLLEGHVARKAFIS